MSNTPQDQDQEYTPITGIAPLPMYVLQTRHPFTELPRVVEYIVMTEQIPQEKEGMIYACMKRLTLPDSGIMAYCNVITEETCAGCGRPTCRAHWSPKTLFVHDREGKGIYQLCQQCSFLPREDVEALRALRLRLNDPWS
jgi:hypothetical protein